VTTEYDQTISTPVRKYLTFVNSPLRSSFKKLFIGTDLGKALWTMSDDKALPKDLKDEQVERGKVRRPQIPYVPLEDPIQETVEKISGTKNFKVTLPDGTVVYHKVYDGGNNESFIIHVKEVIKLAERKNYFDYYEAAAFKKGQCVTQCNKAQRNPTTQSKIQRVR
jgi:hypothetical protein